MATYKQIQNYVKAEFGYVPKTCWIADVKKKHGLTKRNAPNRLSDTKRKYPCPEHKIKDIEKALKQFEVI